MQKAECRRQKGEGLAWSTSAFCILPSAFHSPPHPPVRGTHPLHPLQLFLLLLLHRAQERLGVRVALRLALLRSDARPLLVALLLLLRTRSLRILLLPTLRLLRLRLAIERDLEVALRGQIARPKP